MLNTNEVITSLQEKLMENPYQLVPRDMIEDCAKRDKAIDAFLDGIHVYSDRKVYDYMVDSVEFAKAKKPDAEFYEQYAYLDYKYPSYMVYRYIIKVIFSFYDKVYKDWVLAEPSSELRLLLGNGGEPNWDALHSFAYYIEGAITEEHYSRIRGLLDLEGTSGDEPFKTTYILHDLLSRPTFNTTLESAFKQLEFECHAMFDISDSLKFDWKLYLEDEINRVSELTPAYSNFIFVSEDAYFVKDNGKLTLKLKSTCIPNLMYHDEYYELNPAVQTLFVDYRRGLHSKLSDFRMRLENLRKEYNEELSEAFGLPVIYEATSGYLNSHSVIFKVNDSQIEKTAEEVFNLIDEIALELHPYTVSMADADNVLRLHLGLPICSASEIV